MVISNTYRCERKFSASGPPCCWWISVRLHFGFAIRLRCVAQVRCRLRAVTQQRWPSTPLVWRAGVVALAEEQGTPGENVQVGFEI